MINKIVLVIVKMIFHMCKCSSQRRARSGRQKGEAQRGGQEVPLQEGVQGQGLLDAQRRHQPGLGLSRQQQV